MDHECQSHLYGSHEDKRVASTRGASRTKRRCAVVRVALRVVSKGRQLRPQEKKNGLTGVVVLVLEEGIRLT